MTAHVFNSGFALSHDTFNGMLCASSGKIYYVLCSASIDTGAQMYSYDPETGRIDDPDYRGYETGDIAYRKSPRAM